MIAGGRAAAVLLDRDGVLNELVPDPDTGLGESPLRVQDVRLAPGAAQAARALRQAGYELACVTNQPAAAKGRVSVADLEAIHARVLDLLAEEGVTLDAWRMCLHHPEAVVRGLGGACDCRKPEPGMLLDVAGELGLELTRCWMVGDTDADVQAGRRAGCPTIAILTPDSAHKRSGRETADLTARSLEEAAPLLLAHDAR